MPSCPECVGREWEKRKKQYEEDLKQAETEGREHELQIPTFREIEEELDIPMKIDPSTKHFMCKRCGLYATREQISDIRYKLTKKVATRSDKQYDYLDWWTKSKKEKQM